MNNFIKCSIAGCLTNLNLHGGFHGILCHEHGKLVDPRKYTKLLDAWSRLDSCTMATTMVHAQAVYDKAKKEVIESVRAKLK